MLKRSKNDARQPGYAVVMSTTAEYFRNEQSETIYAVVSGRGILTLRKGGVWEVHPVGSRRWDSLHQSIYRDGRWIEALERSAIARLPPLPDLSDVRAMRWEDNFGAGTRLPAAQRPRLAAAVPEGSTAKAWIVLHEDLYETRMGDGCFRYLHSAHLDEAAARAAVAALEGPYSAGHLREMTIAHQHGHLSIPDLSLSTFDHCEVTAILEHLNRA
jgi:hypothetical protein